MVSEKTSTSEAGNAYAIVHYHLMPINAEVLAMKKKLHFAQFFIDDINIYETFHQFYYWFFYKILLIFCIQPWRHMHMEVNMT